MGAPSDRSHIPTSGGIGDAAINAREGRLPGGSCSAEATVSSTVVDGLPGNDGIAGGEGGSIDGGGDGGGIGSGGAGGASAGGGGSTGSSGSGGGSGDGTRRSQPADRQQARCCRGLTYFSQAMLDTGKLPACIGLPTRPDTPPGLSGVPPETVPAGDFKYVCVGYSVYEEAQLRDSWRDAKAPGTPLQVPYCEGVEIVSAADTSPAAAPVLLKEGLDPGSPPPTPVGQQAHPPERPRQPRPRFATPPQGGPGGEGIDWSGFPERFSKTAGLIVGRMGANINHMAATVKRGYEKLRDEASGGGKRDR